jgi:hypothetical protein
LYLQLTATNSELLSVKFLDFIGSVKTRLAKIDESRIASPESLLLKNINKKEQRNAYFFNFWARKLCLVPKAPSCPPDFKSVFRKNFGGREYTLNRPGVRRLPYLFKKPNKKGKIKDDSQMLLISTAINFRNFNFLKYFQHSKAKSLNSICRPPEPLID